MVETFLEPPKVAVQYRCEVLLIYNCADVIDLSKASTILKRLENQTGWKPLADSSYTGMFRTQPIRLADVSEPFVVAGIPTDRSVEMTIWPTGLVTIKYTFHLDREAELDSLQRLSAGLKSSTVLPIDSKKRAIATVEHIREAMQSPGVRDESEDYLIYIGDNINDAKAFLDENRLEIANLLRGEEPDNPLTEDGIADALRYTFSPRKKTLVVTDWDAAFVCGPKTGNERELLEFVQMQRLELRFLGSTLDRELDEAYDLFDRMALEAAKHPNGIVRGTRETLRQIGMMHHGEGNVDAQLLNLGMLIVDVQVCVKNVSLATNFINDPTLFRLYQLAKERFELDELGKSVTEQLDNLNKINEKLLNRHNATKGHFWELVVVILITIEVVKSFVSH